MRYALPIGDAFWPKVEKRGPDECWPWRYYTDRDGYGRFNRQDKKFQSHRVAWELANGKRPDGCVCHSCDNPPCCNPAHLWVGTQADNIRDMLAKGRRTFVGRRRQEHCPRGHALTPENRAPNGPGKTACRTCRQRRNKEQSA